MVEALGLQPWVRLVPFQNRVDEVFRSLDVVVHASSRREPFGRTIAEAMATGRAVIASCESGAAELFQEGENAVAFPMGSAGALAIAIRELALDPRRRELLGRSARSAAVARYSRDRLASEVLNVYASAGVRGSSALSS